MSELDDAVTKAQLFPGKDSWQPLDEPTIARLEDRLGSALPADYRSFLASYGAARVSFEGTAVVAAPGGERLLIGDLHGAAAEQANGDLFWYLVNHQDEFTDGCLPIGDDIFSNPYQLDPATGAVTYVEWSSGGERHLAATSFTDLIQRIEYDPDDDDD